MVKEVLGLAPDYWTLFDPAVSETAPHKEVLWAAQFDINITLNGRFPEIVPVIIIRVIIQIKLV